jgi:hypothetical protein
MAIIILFGEKLLPESSGRSVPADFSRHARTLVEQYRLSDGMFRCGFGSPRHCSGSGRRSCDRWRLPIFSC